MNRNFDFFQVVCRYCSSNKAPLSYRNNQSERVCDVCFDELQNMLESMEKQEPEGGEEEKEKISNQIKDLKTRFRKGIKDSKRSRCRKPERLLEVNEMTI